MWIFHRKYYQSPKYIIQRGSNIDRLYKSCIDDKFIEYVIKKETLETFDSQSRKIIPKEFERTLGIRPTTLGGDLLHPWGFTEILFRKYPTRKLIVYTILLTLLGTAVLGKLASNWIDIHYPTPNIQVSTHNK